MSPLRHASAAALMPWGYGNMPLGFVGLLLWLLIVSVLTFGEDREIGKQKTVAACCGRRASWVLRC